MRILPLAAYPGVHFLGAASGGYESYINQSFSLTEQYRH